MDAISQNTLLRWLSVEGEFARFLRQVRNPDFIMAPHIQLAMVKWNQAVLLNADARLSAG